MQLNVVNRELSVGSIRVVAVASASVLLVGDACSIRNASVFDTPPESIIVAPIRPLPPEGSSGR
ncbi:MAG TPA: spore gernimation protein GerPD [Paenibacillus sp.]|nr:spore gernimation protein GerPD [Paenibacillus sp.]HZG57117.1 spore gernimation protein GerPD [Paenibacillus sp.]